MLIAQAGTAYSGYVVGTATYDGLTLAQRLVELTDAFTRITLVYGAAGVLSRTTDTRNNGALSTIVIESANEVPATPAGYVLTSTQVVGEAGYETTRYTFAKGDGQISQEDNESNNGALLTRTIRHLTAPAASNPIATPAGYVATGSSYQEADGHRIWTASFAKGEGEISRQTEGQGDGVVITIRHLAAPAAANPIATPSGFLKVSESHQEADGHRIWTASFAKGTDVTDYELNGLKRVTRTLYAATGTDASAYVVGTQTFGTAPTLYLARVRIEDNGVYQRIVAEYLEPGITSREVRLLDGGIKQTTLRAFYTEPTISNAIIVSRTQENEEGYPVWQIVGLTKIDGTSLTSAGAALTYPTRAPFLYPGRAKPYTETATVTAQGVSGSWTFVDVHLSPPVEATVEATVEVSYKTTSAITASDLWNPTEWATLTAYWYNADDQFRQKIETLRGFRAVGDVQTGNSSDPSRTSVLGEWMGYGSSYVVKVAGGPAAPDSNTYTLRYEVEEAFVSISGTTYYRHTAVSATIPAQPALPV